MALCKACGKEPRRGISTLCAGCENARRRQRCKDEREGKRAMKICPHCQTERRAPGRSYCVKCAAEYRRIQSLRQQGVDVTWSNPVKVLRDPDTKYCNSCGRVLLRTLFYNDKYSKDGLTHCCKLCCDLAKQAWRKRHRARVNAYARRYRREHLDEIRQRGQRRRKLQRRKFIDKLLGVEK